MDKPNEYWNQQWSTANSELRGFIAAEAARRQGSEAFLRFQADWHDPQLAQAAQHSYLQAVEGWNISGTPTLVFSNGHAFHLELRKCLKSHSVVSRRSMNLIIAI